MASFMLEIFGTKGMVVTYDIVTYLSSMVAEAFSAVVGESGASVLDLAAEYRKLAEKMQERLNGQMEAVGIEFSDILIENISLPDEVEKLIDEQSGISVANQDMEAFWQYQTARAVREASERADGLVGLGASVAIGHTIAQNIQDMTGQKGEGLKTTLRNVRMPDLRWTIPDRTAIIWQMTERDIP
jgi:membrane protease subunit (stomatin/prohibitin family)